MAETTPAWTKADYEALRRAIASGVRSVRYDGPPMRWVEYHSLKDMRELLAEMRRELNGPEKAPSYRLARFRKGL